MNVDEVVPNKTKENEMKKSFILLCLTACFCFCRCLERRRPYRRSVPPNRAAVSQSPAPRTTRTAAETARLSSAEAIQAARALLSPLLQPQAPSKWQRRVGLFDQQNDNVLFVQQQNLQSRICSRNGVCLCT
jgi:hypothetical protein